MGTIYIDTGGATTNSGSTDSNTASLTGTAATVSTATVSLDGSPNLSALVTSGAAQSSIYLAQATNSNRKIFWITAFDNTAKTVTVDVAPTGVTSSSWAIGGRLILTPAAYEGSLRAGDTVLFNNSPTPAAGPAITCRVSGDGTTGFITYQGKAGVYPVIAPTTSNVINVATLSYIRISDLNLKCGAATPVIQNPGQSVVINNCIIDGNSIATIGANFSVAGCVITNSEFKGMTGDGLQVTATTSIISGDYIHSNGGNGISTNAGTNLSPTILNNLIANNTGRGIYLNGATGGSGKATIEGNTIYGNGNSGLELTTGATGTVLRNNIIVSTTTAVATAKWATGNADIASVHAYNLFWNTIDSNGGTSGLTINSTEVAADPSFTSAGTGDFSLQSASPAGGIGWPGTPLNSSSAGKKDLGAIQRTGSATSSVFGS